MLVVAAAADTIVEVEQEELAALAAAALELKVGLLQVGLRTQAAAAAVLALLLGVAAPVAPASLSCVIPTHLPSLTLAAA